MQLVTLSTRPAVLAETWAHVRQFMGWVDELVVVTPKALEARISIESATVLYDEDITGLSTGQLSALDHTERNFTIRGGLGTRAEVDDVFLMSDDDYRPLKPVSPDFYLDGDRHRGFYFYDLDAWPGDSTTFDAGQHHTRELLGYLGYDRLAYASHMPQVIRKAHLAEAWEIANRLSPTRCLCEWAWYFNVARALHPHDFTDPEPFRTLCWPQYPNEWPWWVRPTEYVFENFYPELYRPGHLFAGLPTTVDPEEVERHNIEKIIRWSDLGRRTARLEFPTDVANPWTQRSTLRRIAFGMLRPLRKVYDYVSLSDRSRLSELSGTVARLEDDLRRTRDT